MHPSAQTYLTLARNALGMDLAWLSEHSGDQQVLHLVDGEARPFGVGAGDALSWTGSFCTRVIDGRLPAAIPDTRANPVTAALPITGQLGIGSYVGAPVHRPDGTVYGMLCCISRGPRRELKDHQVRLLESIAESLGAAMAEDADGQAGPETNVQRVRRAIDAEGMQVVVQPIVELATMRIAGVEALTRFTLPPTRPDVLFAEAHELGLGVPLELAAIRAALALLEKVPAPLYLSVNASAETLASPALREALAAVDGGRVVVELTEHSSVADYDALLRCLDSLRELGVRVAIDDAGAGYASFRHILALRPDVIKFDRALVTGLDGDPARTALVGSMVAFAERIGATLVAEGLETAGELDALARLGVTCGQGYLLARPGPLPLPAITARPTSTRQVDAAAGEPGAPFEEVVLELLHEAAARTGLDASFLSVWDADRQTLGHRVVYDPTGIGIRVGPAVPWRETPCYRCRQAGIIWTADVERDLPGALPPGVDVATFLSVPVLDRGGEMIGTLCAVGRERRFLSDPVLQYVQELSGRITALIGRAASEDQAKRRSA